MRGKDIAKILGYEDPGRAVRCHIDPEDKFQRGGGEGKIDFPSENNLQRGRKIDLLFINTPGGKQKAVLISESGFYSLAISSKLEPAKKFKHWVTSEVLPSIRKYGQYKLFDNPNNNMFKIENEFDLHCKVVQSIRTFYPDAIPQKREFIHGKKVTKKVSRISWL